MICSVCYRMLRGQEGRQWRGTFDLYFAHHPSKSSLAMSAEMGCCFCRVIAEELAHLAPSDRHATNTGHFISAFLCGVKSGPGANGRSKHNFEIRPSSADEQIRRLTSMQLDDSGATLTEFWRLYRLEYKLNNTVPLGSFLLRPSDHTREGRTYTVSSKSTADNEVLELARYWIRRCNGHEHPRCRDWDSAGRKQHFLPRRLIELPKPRKSLLTGEKDEIDDRIKLVETDKLDSEVKASALYVTLSHRWGDGRFTRLLKQNEKAFRKEIPFEALPRTFRDAIGLARRLERGRIGYIWIDSLCIIQDNADDWLQESVKMFQIYANSYCNISATAAIDGSKGLFYPRDPHNLLGDEVSLNTKDLLQEQRTAKQSKLPRGYSSLIRRCEVFDLGLWQRLVEDSPVNRRGWVLQERLLAPRVLHFCQDQIAWECSELDAAESFPDGMPTQEVISGVIQEKVRLKSLLAWQRTSDQRIQMIIDSDQKSQIVHEHWKLVVQRYSSTGLTRGSDKLIALAGIAELLSTQIRGQYIAGLWEKYLASQLLWRVRTAYDNGRLLYPSRRPDAYCAPSFSWASVDAPQGIHCGATKRERNLMIKVTKFHVLFQKTEYGPLEILGKDQDPAEICYIDLECTWTRVFVELYDYRGNPRYHCGFWGETIRYSQIQPSDEEQSDNERTEITQTESSELAHFGNSIALIVHEDSGGNGLSNEVFAEPNDIADSQAAQVEAGVQNQHRERRMDGQSQRHQVRFTQAGNIDGTKPKISASERKAKEAKPTIGVYLDCPDRDGLAIEEEKATVYCVPASWTEGEDLICLLLYQIPRNTESQKEFTYQRVGLITVPSFLPDDQQNFLSRASENKGTLRVI